jgi:hypothetical protein
LGWMIDRYKSSSARGFQRFDYEDIDFKTQEVDLMPTHPPTLPHFREMGYMGGIRCLRRLPSLLSSVARRYLLRLAVHVYTLLADRFV